MGANRVFERVFVLTPASVSCGHHFEDSAAQHQSVCTQSFGMRNHVLDCFLIMVGLGLFASVISVSFKVIDNNITPLYLVQKVDSVLLCRRCQRTDDFDGCDEDCEEN